MNTAPTSFSPAPWASLHLDPHSPAGAVMGWALCGGSIGGLLQMGRKDYDLLYALGSSHFNQGRDEAALEVFSLLVALEPMESRFHHAASTCLQRLGRHRDATLGYMVLKTLEPDNPEPLFRMAECLLALGERESALGMLDTVVDEFSKAPGDWHSRASALARLLRGGSPPSSAREV